VLVEERYKKQNKTKTKQQKKKDFPVMTEV